MNIRNLLALGAATILLATQCQQPNSQQTTDTTAQTDTVQQPAITDTTLVAILQLAGEYRLADSLPLHFTVYNPTADTLRFTQYHTPFEGFINNFLTITDSAGNDVPYIGPMAKRVMPPVEESYRTVPPLGRDTVSIDIKKGYRIDAPGTYTIQYNAGNVSGMANGEAIQVLVKE